MTEEDDALYNPYANILSQFSSGDGNLEPDYYVTQSTLSDRPYLTSSSGETGTFGNGQWQEFKPVIDDNDWFSRMISGIKNAAGKATTGGTAENKGLLALLGALAGYMDKRPPSGGGVGRAYAGMSSPRTRTVTQGRYGPIAKYAADGGLMRAYAQGGEVMMQDGGFVMTKKAVDGAGGMQGLKQLIPAAQPIRGPGTGTSDSIPARIQGPDGGATPARVSNGEAYIPPGNESTQRLYALMRQLERKA